MKKAKKIKRTDLSVRQLTEADAHVYLQISQCDSTDTLHKFVSFLEAHTLEEAKRRIVTYNKQYEKLYGLFTKSNRLVAVFNISDGVKEHNADDIDSKGATVHFFVGKRYIGNNYAVLGLQELAKELRDTYEYFYFEIKKSNSASLAVQEHLGSELVRDGSKHKYYKYYLVS